MLQGVGFPQSYCCTDTHNIILDIRDTLNNSQNNYALLSTAVIDASTNLHTDNINTWLLINTLQVNSNQDFKDTWTALAAVSDLVVQDNAMLQEQLTAIETSCDNLHEDIAGTWTALQKLANDSQNNYALLSTAMIDANTNLHTDNINTWLLINTQQVNSNQDFKDTWTALADIKTTLETYGDTITDNEAQILNTLATVQAVTTAIQTAAQGNSVVTNLPLTITNPGLYTLAQDVSISTGTAITINADDVTVDLNSHIISNSGTATIGINAQTQRKNITIKNGCLKNFNTYGIIIGTAASFSQNILIDGVTTTGCGTGIFWSAVQDSSIYRCKSYFDINTGICLDNGSGRCVIESCLVNDVVLDAGLTITGGSLDISVKNSEFHHNASSGISCRQSASYISVLKCIANNNGENGIELLSDISNCLLMDNEIFNNTLNGIINSGTNNQVFRSVGWGNGTNYTGVSLTSTSLTGLGPWDNLSL